MWIQATPSKDTPPGTSISSLGDGTDRGVICRVGVVATNESLAGIGRNCLSSNRLGVQKVSFPGRLMGVAWYSVWPDTLVLLVGVVSIRVLSCDVWSCNKH